MTNNNYKSYSNRTFSSTAKLFISTKRLRKVVNLLRRPNYQSLTDTEISYQQKLICKDNRGQNLWKRVKRLSKTGQEQKNIDNCFCVFFNIFFMKKRLCTRLYL